MNYRTPKKHTHLQRIKVGPFEVKQPLPSDAISQVSPFILLHHAGPSVHWPDEIKARLSPHPHRGFEPVTFLFNGKIHHRDSLGNEGFLESGDVQWMTAGSGVIHSEGPSKAFAKEGGTMELIQLWVNLPQQYKMTTPKYQDIKKETIPVVEEDNGKIKMHVVAGDYKGTKGPASTFSPVLAMMVNFEAGANAEIMVPENFNALIYVLEGSIESGGEALEAFHMAVFEKDGDTIQFSSLAKGKALFLSGEPINEPVASYGPFVMNYQGEIKQAIMDYEMGKMGILES